MLPKHYATSGKNYYLQQDDPLLAGVREPSPYRSDFTTSSTIKKPFLHFIQGAHPHNEPDAHEAFRINVDVDPDAAPALGPSSRLMAMHLPPPPRELRWSTGSLWAMHLQYDSHAESLQRRIIELERENALLRLALLEGSERRTRQRFSVVEASHTSAMPSADGTRQLNLLHRIREMKHNATRHFEMEMERMSKQHAAQVRLLEGCNDKNVLGAYESVFAEAERCRWKEHVRQTVGEIAQLHKEREQRTSTTATSAVDRWDGGAKPPDMGDTRRTAELEQQVQHWKNLAEREKARANIYQREAMRELRCMNVAHQEALDVQDPLLSVQPVVSSTSPPVSPHHTAPALNKGIEEEHEEADASTFTSTKIKHMPTSWNENEYARMFSFSVATGPAVSQPLWSVDSTTMNRGVGANVAKAATADINPATAPTVTGQAESSFQLKNQQHIPMTADASVVNISDSVGADVPQGTIAPASIQATAALKSSINDLMVYMNAMHISPEEKIAISAIVGSVAQYTQLRLRLDQYAKESESCLQHLNQLSSSIDATFSGIGSTSPTSALMDSFFVPQTVSPGLGGLASAASLQNTGKARVDADLAECLGLLQQVESFTRTFLDLQQRRVCALGFFNPDINCATSGCGGADPSTPGGSANVTSLMTSLAHLQETLTSGVTTLRQLMEQKVHAIYAAECSDVTSMGCGETEGFVSKAGSLGRRMRTTLLQLCDNVFGRVEIMRNRITRLGSARIEEAESLERVLRSMDSYDPALTERAGRRAQIDAELEDLRAWLASLGKLRQRALALTETLQQATENVNAEGGGGGGGCGRVFQAESAATSHRTSVGGTAPGSLDEWRRALTLPEAPAAPTAMAPTPTAMAQGGTMAVVSVEEEESGAGESGRNTMHAVADTTATADAPAAAITAPTAPAPAPALTTATTTTTADLTTETADNINNNNNGKDKGYSNEANFDEDTMQNARNNALQSAGIGYDSAADADIVAGNDETSHFHRSAFDKDSLLPQRTGYLGTIKSFFSAVVQRATKFSDSEDSGPEGERTSRRRETRKRRRLFD